MLFGAYAVYAILIENSIIIAEWIDRIEQCYNIFIRKNLPYDRNMSTNAQMVLDDNSMTLENLCKSILYTSEDIQSVAVINKNGRAIEEKTRGNSNLLIPDNKNEMYFMQCALQISMARDFDEEFGPVGYTITERENSKFVSIPFFSHIILAKMKKGINHTVLINKIKKVIRNFKGHNRETPVLEGDQV